MMFGPLMTGAALRFSLLLFVALPGQAWSQDSTLGRPAIEELIARLDSLVPPILERYGVPGMAIGVVRQGAVVWTRGYGYADRASRKPVTPQTVFNVGSISKTIAAWGAMRLVEQGKLALDRPIDTYLTRWHLPPGQFDPAGVTLERLLSHTAGLSVRGYPGWGSGSPLPTLEESLAGNSNGSGDVRLIVQPGTEWRYSGGGYTVAQLAIEEVSGRPFAEYIRDHVLTPLGLNRSDYGWTPRVVAHAATPYNQLGEPIPGPWPNFPELAAAGFQTTVEDLARFAAVEMTGPHGEPPGRGVLRPETIRRMQSPVSPLDHWGLGYQINWGVGSRTAFGDSGIAVVGHGGSNLGWLTDLRTAPALREGIVTLTNSSNGLPALAAVFCTWLQWAQIRRVPEHCVKVGVERVLYPVYAAGGIDALLARYRQLRHAAADDFNFDEGQLVSVASALRWSKKIADAIVVLDVNRTLFPNHAPTYAALGDAYLAQADTTRAIESYEQSLRIDPKGDAARRQLDRLRHRP